MPDEVTFEDLSPAEQAIVAASPHDAGLAVETPPVPEAPPEPAPAPEAEPPVEAPAPEEATPVQDPLFAGRFKSVQEMESGYLELQNLLSSTRPGLVDEDPEVDEEPEDPTYGMDYWPGDLVGPPTNFGELDQMWQADPKAAYEFVTGPKGGYIPAEHRELVVKMYAQLAGPEFHAEQARRAQEEASSGVVDQVRELIEPMLKQMQDNNIYAATSDLRQHVPYWDHYSQAVGQAWMDGTIRQEPDDLQDPGRVVAKSFDHYLRLRGLDAHNADLAARSGAVETTATSEHNPAAAAAASAVTTNGNAPPAGPGDLIEYNGQQVTPAEYAILTAQAPV